MTPPKPKLNILALPSFTALLFGLIVLVLLGAALASFLPGSQLWWAPLVLGFTLLPLRDFLHWPEREARQYRLHSDTSEEAVLLQDRLTQLSQEARASTPQLLVGDHEVPVHAIGTFRRHFIGAGRSLAQSLANWSRQAHTEKPERVRAILAHELAHFINRDIQLAGLSLSLLKMAFLVAVVNLWISIVLIVMLVEIGPEIAQPKFWVALGHLLPLPGLDLQPMREFLRAENPAVFDRIADPTQKDTWGLLLYYHSLAHLPFVFCVPVLYLFFWRKLMRVREFYADARAAMLMGNAEVVIHAKIAYEGLLMLSPVPACHWPERLKARFNGFLNQIPLLSFHPPLDLLKQALEEDPLVAFGAPWKIAAWTGGAIFLLDLILRGNLTAAYISEPGPHLPLLAASTVFAVWLLPQVCQGRSLRTLAGPLIKMVLLFIIIKLTLTFLDGLLLVTAFWLGNLEGLGRIIDLWAYSFAGVPAGDLPQLLGYEVSWEDFLGLHIFGPIAYFLFFGWPVIVVTLLADIWLKQRVLTWYVLAGRVRYIFWVITITLLVLQLLVAIPLGNRLFFPLIYPDWPLLVITGLALGIFIAVAAGVTFRRYHRSLAHCCPHCQHMVTGGFELGRPCPHCAEELHAWLIARY